VIDLESVMWISVEDLWISGLQVLSIGLAIGIAIGDFLDRRDPLSWKYQEPQEGEDRE